VNSPFRLQGTIARAPYLVASIALLLVQYALQGLVFAVHHGSASEAWTLWVLLPVSITRLSIWFEPRWQSEQWLLIPVMLAQITLTWLLLVAAIRRARSAGRSLLAASMVIIPIIQLVVVWWLGSEPQRTGQEAQVPAARVPPGVAFQGLVVGTALTLLLVLVSTLVFRKYGSLLFLASPFVVGCVTAYIGNRHADIGSTATRRLVFGACFLGGIGLLAIAIEGIVCLVMAAPLIALVAWAGGLAGRAMALKGPGAAPGRTAVSIAVLPLFLAIDVIAPPFVAFEDVQSIEVAATDQAVWGAIVDMEPISDPPAAPFRWGLAYPISGTIQVGGVGAIREGVFSTGIAYERVTEWDPGRRLAFIVLSEPPAMGELSPHGKVNAPHVDGYFRTLETRLTITPLANGRTRLSSTTIHELHLRPAPYWLPMTRWAIRSNKQRVLAHLARQAEPAPELDAMQESLK
jgi:hypothetical protein